MTITMMMITSLILSMLFLLVLMLLSPRVEKAPVRNKERGWVAIAVAAIGAYANSREESSARRQAGKQDLQSTAQQGLEQRRTSQYEADLADYYRQLDKDRKKKALYQYVNMEKPADLMGAKPIADEYPNNSPLVKKPRGG